MENPELRPHSTSTSDRVTRRLNRSTALAVAMFAVSACGANNIRPRTQPLANAFRDTLNAPPDTVIELLRDAVVAHGFTVAAVRASEGFLETRWFDLSHDRTGGEFARDLTRTIRLRFFADPISENRTALSAEAVYRRMLDPSRSPRELETMVPEGSAGDQWLMLVISTMRAALGTSGT